MRASLFVLLTAGTAATTNPAVPRAVRYRGGETAQKKTLDDFYDISEAASLPPSGRKLQSSGGASTAAAPSSSPSTTPSRAPRRACWTTRPSRTARRPKRGAGSLRRQAHPQRTTCGAL